MAGWQCEKYLWFERHQGASKTFDPMAKFLMEQGTGVGVLAQGLFPDAQYEVQAEAKGALAKADILRPVRGAENQWDIYEVKTSGYDPERPYAEDKQEFIWDLALQLHVFEAAGYLIRKASLVLVNKDYERHGPIDPQAYFVIEEVTEKVRALLPEVPAMLERFKAIAAKETAPDIRIGMQCKKPHDCPYQDHCFPEQGLDHIFRLRNLWWKDKFKALDSGIQPAHPGLSCQQAGALAGQASGRIQEPEPP